MKIYTHLFFSSLLLSFLFLSCSKEEDEQLPEINPSITTLDPQIPEDGGVILKGELEGAEHIQEYGFFYSTDSSFSAYETKVISFDKPTQDGSFEAIINTDLYTDRSYYYKAYILSKREEISGKTKTFIASGNKRPIITRVVPEKGHLQDTIKIHGKYFGRQSQAFLDSKWTTIIDRNDTILTCIVPSDLERIRPEVQVRSGEVKRRVDGLFSLFQPEIHSISKTSGTFRDLIEIGGDHFDIAENRTKVWFNQTPAKVAGTSRKSIFVVVPDNLEFSSNDIKVNAQNQDALSPEKFVIRAPEISKIPATVNSEDRVTIEGLNFHPLAYKNKVFFGEAEAEVLSGGGNQLSVKVPKGPYPQKEDRVKVKILDIEGISEAKFSFADTWRMISDNLPFYYYRSIGSFVIDNIAYVLAPPKKYSTYTVYLWVFNSSDHSWEKREIPIDLGSGGIVFGDGRKAYLYTGTSSNNFYEYKASTNTWGAKPDFPGGKRRKPVSFALSNGAYIGLGVNRENWETINYTDFYHFNTSTNTWTRKNDFEGKDREYFYTSLKEASIFVLNDEAYVGGGGSDTGKTEFWKYDADHDHWLEKAEFHEAHYGSPTFVLNDKGYVADGLTGGGCYMYDPVNNTWTHKPGPDNYWGNTGSFAFVVDGIPFIGGGERRTYKFYMLNVSEY